MDVQTIPDPRHYILPGDLNERYYEDHRIPERCIEGINGPNSGLYLELIHGRRDPDQQMDDWGETGPTLGPFKWVHFTYGNYGRINLGEPDEDIWLDHNFSADACHLMPPHSLCRHDDMLFFDGVFYGDWTFFIR